MRKRVSAGRIFSFAVVLALLASCCSFLLLSPPSVKVVSASPDLGWLSGWDYRKKITINSAKIGSTLSDFPVLVALNESNFDFSKARSDGYDIRFTKSDGTTLLKYERERHDQSGQKAEYWVKIPSVSSSSDTSFYIYYGNTGAGNGEDVTGVWDPNFKAVWHLVDDDGNTDDSTSNSVDLTKKGTVEPAETDAKIAKGQHFDGTNDYLKHLTFLDTFPAKLTVSFWFKPDVTFNSSEHSTDDMLVEKVNGPETFGLWNFLTIWLDEGDGKLTVLNYHHKPATTMEGYYLYSSQTSWTGGTWYYATVVIGSSGGELWVNDGLENENANTWVPGYGTNNDFFIGNARDSSAPFDGVMDEVRVSNVDRGDAWIKASYESGRDNLVTFGSEETVGKPVLVSPGNNYSTSDKTPTFTWTAGLNADNHRLVIDNSSDFSDGDNIYNNANLAGNATTCTIEDELPVDNYWWKVCATNTQGDNWSENTWTFEVVPPAPTVTTEDATGVAATSARLNMRFTVGSYSVDVWFQYRVQGADWTDTFPFTTSAAGIHSEPLTGLTSETLYEFKAVLEYGTTTIYGETKSFTTTAPGAPTVTTGDATDISGDSAKLNMIFTVGGYSSVEVWFVYDSAETTHTPYTSGGPHSATLTELTSDKLYEFKAVLKYDTTTREGATKHFTTSAEPLTITTQSLVHGAREGEYSKTLVASGGAGGYTWENIGSLPDGLTLSTGGVISGTPTTEENKTFNVKVTDSASDTATRELSITIDPPGALLLDVRQPVIMAVYDKGSTITIEVNVTQYDSAGVLHPTDVHYISFESPSGEDTIYIRDPDATGSYSTTYTLGYEEPSGEWSIEFKAVLSASSGSYEWPIIIKPALITVSLVSPTSGSEIQLGDPVTVCVAATYPDNKTPVTNADITVTTPSGDNISLTYDPFAGYYTASFTPESEDVGLWYPRISAKDLYGNLASEDPSGVSSGIIVTITPMPFLVQYWWAVLAGAVAGGTASAFAVQRVRITSKLKKIVKEKGEILKLMKEAETKYYKDGSLSRDAFDKLITEHETRMANLEKEERVIGAKKKAKVEVKKKVKVEKKVVEKPEKKKKIKVEKKKVEKKKKIKVEKKKVEKKVEKREKKKPEKGFFAKPEKPEKGFFTKPEKPEKGFFAR